jgi:hypothetical protein
MSIHACKEIMDEIERESNSDKLKGLAKKLNDAMLADEREKVSHPLGCRCSLPSRFLPSLHTQRRIRPRLDHLDCSRAHVRKTILVARRLSNSDLYHPSGGIAHLLATCSRSVGLRLRTFCCLDDGKH